MKTYYESMDIVEFVKGLELNEEFIYYLTDTNNICNMQTKLNPFGYEIALMRNFVPNQSQFYVAKLIKLPKSQMVLQEKINELSSEVEELKNQLNNLKTLQQEDPKKIQDYIEKCYEDSGLCLLMFVVELDYDMGMFKNLNDVLMLVHKESGVVYYIGKNFQTNKIELGWDHYNEHLFQRIKKIKLISTYDGCDSEEFLNILGGIYSNTTGAWFGDSDFPKVL